MLPRMRDDTLRMPLSRLCTVGAIVAPAPLSVGTHKYMQYLVGSSETLSKMCRQITEQNCLPVMLRRYGGSTRVVQRIPQFRRSLFTELVKFQSFIHPHRRIDCRGSNTAVIL